MILRKGKVAAMRRPPQLWDWMMTHWCPMPMAMAWLMWRALHHARWSTAVAWRETFLAFERPDRAVSRDVVEAFLAEVASPAQLVDLVEHLSKEHVLLRRDAQKMVSRILAHVNKEGQWKHEQCAKGGRG